MELTENPLIEAARHSAEYQQTLANYSDREWRLDHLYRIQDQDGNESLFVRNAAQRAFSAAEHVRNLIVKARQLGFSTLIELEMLDYCMFRSNTAAGIIDASLSDAKKKLEKISFAYERMPEEVRLANPLTRDNAEDMEWENGSSIRVGTSHRGGTLQLLHVSEYGKVSADNPTASKKIKTGAFPAVHAGGRIWVESTAHGQGGDFHSMVMTAQGLQQAGLPLTNLDYRLHFYPWWMHREYRLPDSRPITAELREYFQELQSKGINIDAQQAAWYSVMLETLGLDDMRSEYPSTIEEAFFATIEGGYFKREMTRARLEKRVGGQIPFDPSYQVNTAWDIGEDTTSIWFIQTDGLRHRWIDYWEAEGGSIQHAATILDEKRRERSFIYGTHYGPHDLENRDWGDNSRSRKAQAESLGIKFKVVPRVTHKEDSIEALRRILNLSWFDQQHCDRGVKALDNYRKKWNKTLAQFEAEPVHDWSSHPSDAAQQYAMGVTEKPKKEEKVGKPEKKGSAWAS